MAFLSSLNIAGSALSVQKQRMNVISQNIANASTTRTEEGGPYIRKAVVVAEKEEDVFASVLDNQNRIVRLSGVEIAEVIEDPNPLKAVYDPTHPDANEEGYVMMPNVDTTTEMVDMISATRSYEANVTAINAVKSMAAKALEIGR